MRLEEFIEARIAEDEQIAREASDPGMYDSEDAERAIGAAAYGHLVRQDPVRVLRQCTALRAVLEFGAPLVSASQQIEFEDTVLLSIAAIWSDHPDYQREWATP